MGISTQTNFCQNIFESLYEIFLVKIFEKLYQIIGAKFMKHHTNFLGNFLKIIKSVFGKNF